MLLQRSSRFLRSLVISVKENVLLSLSLFQKKRHPSIDIFYRPRFIVYDILLAQKRKGESRVVFAAFIIAIYKLLENLSRDSFCM